MINEDNLGQQFRRGVVITHHWLICSLIISTYEYVAYSLTQAWSIYCQSQESIQDWPNRSGQLERPKLPRNFGNKLKTGPIMESGSSRPHVLILSYEFCIKTQFRVSRVRNNKWLGMSDPRDKWCMNVLTCVRVYLLTGRKQRACDWDNETEE